MGSGRRGKGAGGLWIESGMVSCTYFIYRKVLWCWYIRIPAVSTPNILHAESLHSSAFVTNYTTDSASTE